MGSNLLLEARRCKQRLWSMGGSWDGSPDRFVTIPLTALLLHPNDFASLLQGAQPDLLPPGPPGEAEAVPSPGQAPDAAAAARAVSSDGTAAGDAAQAAAATAAAPDAAAAGDAAGGPPTVVVPPAPGAPGATQESPAPPEKLSQFVNFLNGENPGACMFHAQMRLSPEGCMKLANFLRSSARVRALSLSHNYLGEGRERRGEPGGRCSAAGRGCGVDLVREKP